MSSYVGSIDETRDFFISFNKADREWAKWIAYVIEEHGYSVYFQDWDFSGNFVEHMDRAHRICKRTIAILSDHYFGSAFTLGEWTARYAQDPAAREDRLVAIRVGMLTEPGLLGAILYADLTECDESEAEQRVLGRIRRATNANFRAKPSIRPPYPCSWPPSGTRPALDQRPAFPTSDKAQIDSGASLEDSQSSADRRFSESIRSRMAALNRAVEELTSDQLRIIDQLRFNNRVRVRGCAGSGKTLVATEKAIRLARGGVETLLLCHNPMLAEHIRSLTEGTDVDVTSFQEWVARFESYGTEDGTKWTHYEEPDSDTLRNAFDKVIHNRVTYGAIIVDEAQDFREEWWPILEAALYDPLRSIFYIFHDNHQALLPYRSIYPVEQPVVDLSRNCRNAAEIYEILRLFHPQSPEPEVRLRHSGMTMVYPFEVGEELTIATQALNRIYHMCDWAEIVALTGGPWPLENSPFKNLTVPLMLTESWQDSVQRHVLYAIRFLGLKSKLEVENKEEWVREQLNKVSEEPHPVQGDIALVTKTVRQIHVPVRDKRWARERLLSEKFSWIDNAGRLELLNVNGREASYCDTVVFFENESWADSLPKPRYIHFTREPARLAKDQIQITDVASFKGLEVDCALLLFSDYTAAFESELYVALSRARIVVSLLIRRDKMHLLPPKLRRIAVTEPDSKLTSL